MKRRKVWVISELYYPEETSTGYLMTKTAEELARQFEVAVLCSQPTYSARGKIAPADEVHRGVTIHRCWGTKFNKDILLLRLINILTISFSMFFNAVLRIRSGDVAIVVTNPPALPFIVSGACQLRRSKCILVIHDVYPEALVAMGVVDESALLNRIVGWLTNALYRKMSRIVALGHDMASLAARKIHSGDSQISVIPNWADLDFVKPTNRNENRLLRELGLTGKFVIQYAGNMGRTHDIETLVRCAQQMLNDLEVQFLFIGSGAKKTWLMETIREQRLTNITVLDNRPRSDQPNFLNACDLAIISFIKGMAGISVPSRMYNIMAVGKPIIAVADNDSELDRVIREEGIGWVVTPGDDKGIRMVILQAKKNPDLLAQMRKRARWAAQNKYTLEIANRAYIELLNSLASED